MTKQNRRLTLRAETRDAHAALDRQIGPLNSRHAYVAYARGLHAFRKPLERSLSAFGPFGDWRPSTLAPLLEADLADLAAAPHDPTPTAIANASEAIGALYVLEGSALGARVLRAMARDLGFDGAWGARHLERQAASLDNWRTFLNVLEAAPALDIAHAAKGARAAFAAASHAMSRSLAHA